MGCVCYVFFLVLICFVVEIECGFLECRVFVWSCGNVVDCIVGVFCFVIWWVDVLESYCFWLIKFDEV